MIKSGKSHFAKINDGFSQVLKEAEDAFAAEGIQMLGEGIREILTEDVYFESYVDRLVQGLDAGDEEIVRGLCENTRDHILSESGLTGIVPLSSLSMPTLRKSWPRLAITKAIPTEATDSPKFKVTFFEPWIKDSNGKKMALPAALLGNQSDIANRKPIVSEVLVSGLAAGFDLVPAAEKLAAGAWKHGASIDTDLRLTGVVKLAPADFATATGATAPAGDVLVRLVGLETLNGGQHVGEGLKLDTRTSMISGKFGLTVDASTPALTAPQKDALEAKVVSVFVKVDLQAGTCEGAVLGGVNVKALGVVGYISTEMNTYTQDVGFDVQDKEVVVPTAAHLSASLPTEYLTDLMRMYQIDGVSKVVDIMSDVLAQKVDLEGIDFLKNQYVASGARYENEFNVTPIATFNGTPTEWRREIRTVINFMGSQMINDFFYNNGHFVLVGNPIDIDVIPNVDWVFTSQASTGGVKANYQIGAYSGAHEFTIISSPNIRRDSKSEGSIYMFYVPHAADQKTFNYYPYSFAVERGNGYINPQAPNVPSVILSRRHVFDATVPVIGRIVVSGHDGQALGSNIVGTNYQRVTWQKP